MAQILCPHQLGSIVDFCCNFYIQVLGAPPCSFHGSVHLRGVKLILRAVVMHQLAPGAHARQLVCVPCRKIGCRRAEVWANERWEELLEHGRVISILLLLRKDKNRRNKTWLTAAGKKKEGKKTLEMTLRCFTRSSFFFFFFPLSEKSWLRCWDTETEEGVSVDLLQFTHFMQEEIKSERGSV